MNSSPYDTYVVDFPTSISERGDHVAALVSSDDNCERRCNQWLLVRDVVVDKILHKIRLMDRELSTRIGQSCFDDAWSTCPQKQEVERRVEAANAVLATDRWRRIPCYKGGLRADRMEGGCEAIQELDVQFQSPYLIVKQRGRLLLSRRVPSAWIYRDASCTDASNTDIESYALDPETGTLVVGFWYWAGYEGCSPPRWDFHPIRIPALRRKPTQDLEGGAP